MTSKEKILRLKRGNTALIEALMDMCGQHCSSQNYGKENEFTEQIVSHDFLSSNERALALLNEAGYADTEDHINYLLRYDKLQKRIEGEQ